jgi:lipoate-protein ligase A
VPTTPSWRLLLDDIRQPFLHFSVEESVLNGVDEGTSPPTLRLRRSDPSVWIGIYQLPEEDVDLEYCAQRSLPIVRRYNPGGARSFSPALACRIRSSSTP